MAAPLDSLYSVVTALFRGVSRIYGKMVTLSVRMDRIVCRALYGLQGKPAWSMGYGAARTRAISEKLERGDFNPDVLPEKAGVGFDERYVEYPWLFHRLPRGAGSLLDAGSVLNFDYILEQPALKEKQLTLFTLAPESECSWWKGISYQYGDLRNPPFRDEAFDWIVSLSTIEHVGMNNSLLYTPGREHVASSREEYLLATGHLARCLKRGGTAYISLPFGTYGHFDWLQVFDGAMVDRLVEAFAPSRRKEWYYRYHRNGWRACSREQASDATYFDFRKPKPNPEGVLASEAIVCLELTR